MNDTEQAKACAELDGRKFNKAKVGEHLMTPCPKCHTHRLSISNCNYSSFNAGHIICECGYKYDIRNIDTDEEFVKDWNSHIKRTLKPYLTSRDAIFPLIIKYCGDDNKRWAKFALALGKELNISAVWCFKRTIRAMVKATPRQLVKALLVAAERWVD